MKHGMSLEEHFYGTATVGERGQVVIPAEARKKFGINPGDKVLVMGHPTGGGVVLCKIDSMREFASTFLDDLERLETTMAQSDEPSRE